jgi:hypothetical protein
MGGAARSTGGAIMSWTKEKPTKPGSYWYRKRAGKVPIVYDVDYHEITHRLVLDPTGLDLAVDEMSGEFSGPIEPPEERP